MNNSLFKPFQVLANLIFDFSTAFLKHACPNHICQLYLTNSSMITDFRLRRFVQTPLHPTPHPQKIKFITPVRLGITAIELVLRINMRYGSWCDTNSSSASLSQWLCVVLPGDTYNLFLSIESGMQWYLYKIYVPSRRRNGTLFNPGMVQFYAQFGWSLL